MASPGSTVMTIDPEAIGRLRVKTGLAAWLCAAAIEGLNTMRLISACSTLSKYAGAAVLVAVSLPALAGDLSNGAAGGIRDYGSGGVPVPAPMPYEENFKWYVRGDWGTSFKNSGSVKSEGLPLAITQPQNWHEVSILSFGFGRYLTPSIRVEGTVDYAQQRVIASGAQTLPDVVKSRLLPVTNVTTTTTLPSGVTTSTTVPVINFGTNIYTVQRNEHADYTNATFLMSAFYDFNREGKLKPYVGAGVGIAMHQMTRTSSEYSECTSGQNTGTNTVTGATLTTLGCNNATVLPIAYSSATRGTAIGYGMAAQFSAGLSYDITQRTHWDTGYRMLWQSGRLGVVSDSVVGSSVVRIADRFEHQVRTGLRWDIW
jgi:opacity protein-like surface antigen